MPEVGVAEIKVSAYNLKEDIALEFKAGEDGDLFEADYDNGVLTISAEANSSTNELNATLYVRSGNLEQVITISQAAYVEPGEGGDDKCGIAMPAGKGFTLLFPGLYGVKVVDLVGSWTVEKLARNSDNDVAEGGGSRRDQGIPPLDTECENRQDESKENDVRINADLADRGEDLFLFF